MAVVMKANKNTLTSIILSPSFAGLSNSSFERIANMTKLTHLAVGGSKLNVDGIENLAFLTELRSLKVPGIVFWNGAPVTLLVNLFSQLKKLEQVEIIMERTYPSDEVVESLVNNNPNLHHLDIGTSGFLPPQTAALSSKSLILIANSFPKLTYIGIGHLTMFSSNDILQLVTKCPKLKHANFEKTRVDDTALAVMAQNCLDLEYLNISGCINYSISSEAVDRLEIDRPHLRIVDEDNYDDDDFFSGPELFFCSLM